MSWLSKATTIYLLAVSVSAGALDDAETLIDNCSSSRVEKRALEWAFAFPVALSRAPDELTVENVERLQIANRELIEEIYDFSASYKAASVIINKRCGQNRDVLAKLRQRYVVAWKIYRELEYVEKLLVGSREYESAVKGLENKLKKLEQTRGEL